MKMKILLEQLEYDLQTNKNRLNYIKQLIKENLDNTDLLLQYNYSRIKYQSQNKYIKSLIRFIKDELSKI